MGEIHLCIYRVRLLGARPVRDKQMLSSEKVHERSKKAGAHRIQCVVVLHMPRCAAYWLLD
jgi:hypothetical protein